MNVKYKMLTFVNTSVTILMVAILVIVDWVTVWTVMAWTAMVRW